jgi:PhzF family phenazine biosynthesis protein
MPQLNFVTLDVFTQTRFEGNPLAVVTVPVGLEVPTQTLQTIAREFNLSETVFLYENEDAATAEIPAWRVRIFMVDHELPFAGHPTIGTACYSLGTLAKGKSTGRLLCQAGNIEIDFADEVANAAIPHNVHVHTETPFTVADVELLQPKLKGEKMLDINVVSPVKGMNFINVELPDIEALGKVECSGVVGQPAPDPVRDQ